MKRQVLLITGFLSAALVSYGQKQFRLKKVKNANDNCIYKKKYTAEQRRNLFPFNLADTIKLVSFRYHRNNYPFAADSIRYDSLIESITLSNLEIDSLSDLTENHFRIKSSQMGHVNMCFFPRNAILFIDRAGRLKAHLLICFHCSQSYLADSDSCWDISKCNQMFEMIHEFFISRGIRYGTDVEQTGFPGETDGSEINYLPQPSANIPVPVNIH